MNNEEKKQRNKEMQVNIFTINEGLTVIENVKIIRLKSEDYNLLIMKDYMPIIGEIDGEISFQSDIINKKYDNIKAFYMLKDNEFNLIIRQDL